MHNWWTTSSPTARVAVGVFAGVGVGLRVRFGLVWFGLGWVGSSQWVCSRLGLGSESGLGTSLGGWFGWWGQRGAKSSRVEWPFRWAPDVSIKVRRERKRVKRDRSKWASGPSVIDVVGACKFGLSLAGCALVEH